MPLTSDLQIDYKRFDSQNISEQTHVYNAKLIQIAQDGPKWFEVGAEKYRQMRWNGETPLPKPIVVESATNIAVSSRETGRSIPCRVFRPQTGSPKGVFYHIHGGGWVLQSEAYQDNMLQHYADHSLLIVVSVGYRLAPENPYPAGNEDCFDTGEYLVENSQRDYNVPLLFIGGDSAGAHLSVLTCFHLLEKCPTFAFRGLVLNFGVYDLSGMLPQVYHFDQPLVLYLAVMKKYLEAYLPNTSMEQRRDMWISPFFANLNKMKLPPALFTCGTEDPLLDDSVMMATKWLMSGAESILKVYPGAPHGFCFFPVGNIEATQQVLDDIEMFMNERSR